MTSGRKLTLLACTVCGESAGMFQQHWNRDTGFGVCASCADWLLTERSLTDAEMLDQYGRENVNWRRQTEAERAAKFK